MHLIDRCDLTVDQRKGLLGVHSFSGNDQNSCFLRKGEGKYWKVAQKHIQAFCQLGQDYHISNVLRKDQERFVCHLYGGTVAMSML